MAEKYELCRQVIQNQHAYSKIAGTKPTKKYVFSGWYELPSNLEDLQSTRKGKYLYITESSGEKIRYTID